jgi:hypothetical protein
MGLFADHRDTIGAIMTRMDQNVTAFNHGVLEPETKALRIKAIVSFTPSRTYVRADCPRYGELMGPSCFTAPEVPVAPALGPALGSRGLPMPPGVSENRPNLAPPRGSVAGAGGEAPGQGAPVPAPAESPLPPPLPAESPLPPPPTAPTVQPHSAIVGGNVGPVGSSQEKEQLSLIVGEEANAATEFLLGPLARGANVHVTRDPEVGG